ncbi:MAG TPA: GNAT family N-acetyltransferase [Acidimicrobiia bacterium]
MDENSQLETVSIPLGGGLAADVRPLMPGDTSLLEAGFENLSHSSRFARFGMGMDHLSKQELRYLTDVDQHHHVAWGALIAGEAAGVARYLVLPDDVSAEIAVTVVDRFQRLGLGRQLFQALVAVARHDGLAAFRFEVDPSNEPVHWFMRDIAGGYPEPGNSLGEVSIVNLPEGEMDRQLVEMMDSYRQPRGD